jgi:hypothetical protein
MPPNTDAPLEEGRAGQAHNLFAVVEQMQSGDAHGVDQDDATIIVVAVGRRSAGQASVGRLHDDDLVGGNARLQYAPLLNQGAGTDHSDDRAAAKPESSAEPTSALRVRQNMRPADDCV